MTTWSEIAMQIEDEALAEHKKEEAIKEANRVAVTAQWLWEERIDIPGYIFSDENQFYGLDPWIVITGVDATTDGSKIILQYGRTGEMLVPLNFQVFVNRNAIKEPLDRCGNCMVMGVFIGLSRSDNETPLCPPCEEREALEEYYQSAANK